MDIDSVTTGAINGTGNFDKLMQTVSLHLREELRTQRITSDKYAEVYMTVMNQVLAQSIQFTLSEATVNPQSELINQQIKSEKAKIIDVIDGSPVLGTIGKQKEVYTAQVKGFKDKAIQELASGMMQGWIVQRTTDSGIQPTIDTGMYDNNIGSAVNAWFKQAGVEPVPLTDIPSLKVIVDATTETLSISGSLGINGDSTNVTANMEQGNLAYPIDKFYVDLTNNFTGLASEKYQQMAQGSYLLTVAYNDKDGTPKRLRYTGTKA